VYENPKHKHQCAEQQLYDLVMLPTHLHNSNNIMANYRKPTAFEAKTSGI